MYVFLKSVGFIPYFFVYVSVTLIVKSYFVTIFVCIIIIINKILTTISATRLRQPNDPKISQDKCIFSFCASSVWPFCHSSFFFSHPISSHAEHCVSIFQFLVYIPSFRFFVRHYCYCYYYLVTYCVVKFTFQYDSKDNVEFSLMLMVLMMMMLHGLYVWYNWTMPILVKATTSTHTHKKHWQYLWQLIRFLCVAFHSTKRQTNRLFLHVIEAHCPPLNDYSINNNEHCITWLIYTYTYKKKSALTRMRAIHLYIHLQCGRFGSIPEEK